MLLREGMYSRSKRTIIEVLSAASLASTAGYGRFLQFAALFVVTLWQLGNVDTCRFHLRLELTSLKATIICVFALLFAFSSQQPATLHLPNYS
jgi:hypothetical protein